MTYDLVVLCQRVPNIRDIVAGMAAAGRELRVRQVADGAVIQLCDDEGRPLVSVETPVLVQVPGEVERVLGDVAGEPVRVPVWWVELRASARAGASPLAHAFADEVAGRLSGRVWVGRPPAGTGVAARADS